jgi:hypothetical protein
MARSLDMAFGMQALRPPDRRADPDPEPIGRFPGGRTARDRPSNTGAKILNRTGFTGDPIS